MHQAALALDQVQGETLLSFGGGYCWRQVLEVINRRFPELKNADSLEENLWRCGDRGYGQIKRSDPFDGQRGFFNF